MATGVGFEGDPTDAILDSLDALGAIDAVASASEPLSLVSAMFTLDAENVESAIERGTAFLRDAFWAAGIDSLSRVTVEDIQATKVLELLECEVSGAEVARAAGLSRERIRQLCDSPMFPSPVRKQGRSVLWRWRDVADFFARRGTPLDETRFRSEIQSKTARSH
jgi:predicted DNA-binding transcriptional regulator AlpA